MTICVTSVRSRRTLTDAMTVITAAVNLELEKAGATLLALPMSGHSTRLRAGGLDFVRDQIEAYGWVDLPLRPAAPSSRAISRMDEALSWLALIPDDRTILRRIVGSRALVHPVTDRHLFSWRRLGNLLQIDYKTAQMWHADGIDLIVAGLVARDGDDFGLNRVELARASEREWRKSEDLKRFRVED